MNVENHDIDQKGAKKMQQAASRWPDMYGWNNYCKKARENTCAYETMFCCIESKRNYYYLRIRYNTNIPMQAGFSLSIWRNASNAMLLLNKAESQDDKL